MAYTKTINPEKINTYIPGTGYKVLDSYEPDNGLIEITVEIDLKYRGGGYIWVIDENEYNSAENRGEIGNGLVKVPVGFGGNELKKKVSKKVIVCNTKLYLIDGTGEGTITWSVNTIKEAICCGSNFGTFGKLQKQNEELDINICRLDKGIYTLYLYISNDDQVKRPFEILCGDNKIYDGKAWIYSSTFVQKYIYTDGCNLKIHIPKFNTPEHWWYKYCIIQGKGENPSPSVSINDFSVSDSQIMVGQSLHISAHIQSTGCKPCGALKINNKIEKEICSDSNSLDYNVTIKFDKEGVYDFEIVAGCKYDNGEKVFWMDSIPIRVTVTKYIPPSKPTAQINLEQGTYLIDPKSQKLYPSTKHKSIRTYGQLEPLTPGEYQLFATINNPDEEKCKVEITVDSKTVFSQIYTNAKQSNKIINLMKSFNINESSTVKLNVYCFVNGEWEISDFCGWKLIIKTQPTKKKSPTKKKKTSPIVTKPELPKPVIEKVKIDVLYNNDIIETINEPGTYIINETPVTLNMEISIVNKTKVSGNYILYINSNGSDVRKITRNIKDNDIVNTTYTIIDDSTIVISTYVGTNKISSVGPFVFIIEKRKENIVTKVKHVIDEIIDLFKLRFLRL